LVTKFLISCFLRVSAIFLYLWLVVFSYYQLLKEEGGHGFYAKTRY
jgi:hypothetical protein